MRVVCRSAITASAIALLAASVGAAPQAGAAKAEAKTVTGNVVDAACFMIHPQAANTPTHEECGAACLAHGVPLAIAGDDGSLYFAADGNKRLSAFHGQHVKATGAVVTKAEPMELKMPVGEKNTMTVRIDGGYKLLTMESIAKAPAAK
jgi:hypothetical protein